MNRFPAIFFIMFVAACNAVLGLDERPAQETSGSGQSGGGGGALSCGACEADIPAGWSGPTAIRTGETALACDAPELANVELTLHDELVPTPAECVCACDGAVGVSCNTSSIQINTYDDDGCTDPRDSGAGVVGACVNLCCGGDSANYVKPVPDVSGASCASTTLVDSAPAPVWAASLIGCGPIASATCGEQRCFVPPAEGALCIHKSGDHVCPEGPFSEERVWFASFEDTRACEPCGCSPVDTADCNEVVTGYAVNNCTVGDAVLAPAPGCTVAPVDFDGARIQSVDPTGSCTPTGGTPTGEVTPSQPTTVCCLP